MLIRRSAKMLAENVDCAGRVSKKNLALRKAALESTLPTHNDGANHRVSESIESFFHSQSEFLYADLLDHVIILNERHLKRLMSSYLLYYHQDRTHLGLAKDTPASRPTEMRSARERKIQSFPRLGGLHHRYAVAA